MVKWLFKQEPSDYSYDDLAAEGKTIWEGVNNPLAKQYLRQVQSGDQILFYHTGKEKAIVGIMAATEEAKSDPNDEKAVIVSVKPVEKLKQPLTLTRIKQEPKLANWELVRLARLSVMPITKEQWSILKSMLEEV